MGQGGGSLDRHMWQVQISVYILEHARNAALIFCSSIHFNSYFLGIGNMRAVQKKPNHCQYNKKGCAAGYFSDSPRIMPVISGHGSCMKFWRLMLLMSSGLYLIF